MKTTIENIILVIIAAFIIIMAMYGMAMEFGYACLIIAPALYGAVMLILYRRGKLDKILH